MNKIESMNVEGEGNRKNYMLQVMIVLVGIVVILSLVQTFQIRALKAEASTGGTGAAVTTATGAYDTSSWTENEKMNYEMHGTVPARLKSTQSSSSSSASAMVGGC